MTLVTVVVIGHMLVLVPGEGRNSQIYDFIYSWHIPAFVLVTGYLSRSFVWTRPKLWALFCTIVVPYVIFEWAMLAFRGHYGDTDPGSGPMWLDPHWPMWYLTATFLWRMATPILVKHWSALPLSVVASLLIGTQSAEWTTWLDLQRTIGFLPFFVLGLHLTPREVGLLKHRFSPVVGVTVLVGIFVVAGHTDEWIATKWLWYSIPFDSFGVDTVDGMWNRFRVLLLGAAGSLAVLSVIPRRRTWFTDMGAATLVVYLFHGFFVRRLEFAGYPDWANEQGTWTIWPTMALAVLVAVVLAAPPVARRLTWAVDPIGSVQRARSR